MTRTALSLLAVVLGAAGLTAQGVPTPTYMVPAPREPHHTVKLENEYVRVLDVTVPPYDSTLYHIHENPYVYVSIGAATLKAQVEGSPDIVDLILKDGEVRYSGVITHRVGNIGSTPFRNITIQIQGRDTLPISTRGAMIIASAEGSAVALENELVRIDRVTLAPGKSSGVHTHPRSSLLVVVHGGPIAVEAPGTPSFTRSMKPGDFDWHTGAYTHAFTNTGTAPFEAIEVVWK